MLLPSQCDHELDYNDILLAVFNQLDCYSDVLDFSLELYSNGFVTYFEVQYMYSIHVQCTCTLYMYKKCLLLIKCFVL